MQPVTLDTKLPRDHEERRLLAAYKASSDKGKPLPTKC
jgi:hypothetical protein